MRGDAEGGLRTMPCPYGGSGTVVLRLDQDGEVYGKCGYSSEWRTHLDYSDKSICPSRRSCNYRSGDWVKF